MTTELLPFRQSNDERLFEGLAVNELKIMIQQNIGEMTNLVQI